MFHVKQLTVPGAVKNPKSLLFTPKTIKKLTFPNRIMVSPMCMYSSQNGLANNFHLVHAGQFALRGVGLVMMEGTSISKESRISPYCLGLWSQKHADALKPVTEFVHSVGGRIGIQIAHAGRKASTYPLFDPRVRKKVSVEDNGWPDEVYGPSSIPYDKESNVPKSLSQDLIKKCIKQFGQTAKYAQDAGFDVLELQAAHGYLLHSFLSPLSNQRTDEYGGSLENRSRMLLETVKEVKKVFINPLFVRLSCTDWVEKSSWDISEAKVVSEMLKAEGVDVVDCSSGGLHPDQKIDYKPSYQVQFAREIREILPTVAVGAISNAKQAEEILQSKSADFIMMARPFLRDSLVYKSATELNEDVNFVHQYFYGKFP